MCIHLRLQFVYARTIANLMRYSPEEQTTGNNEQEGYDDNLDDRAIGWVRNTACFVKALPLTPQAYEILRRERQ